MDTAMGLVEWTGGVTHVIPSCWAMPNNYSEKGLGSRNECIITQVRLTIRYGSSAPLYLGKRLFHYFLFPLLQPQA